LQQPEKISAQPQVFLPVFSVSLLSLYFFKVALYLKKIFENLSLQHLSVELVSVIPEFLIVVLLKKVFRLCLAVAD
jgi:hypothetical protein